MIAQKDPYTINSSAIKAFSILEYLAKTGVPKDLGVISADLHMNKSTIYRFLATLCSLGYVVQNPDTGRYALGSKVVWLASRFLESIDLRVMARPFLESLVEKTRETVHLAILDNYEVVYIDKVDGLQPVKMASRIGGRMPAHSTGLGKALLAYLDEIHWREYINKVGLRVYTPNTIYDPDTFIQHLRQIRECGYSIDNSENEEGIRCVAVPVFDHTGQTIAALSISGWSLTMTPERDVELSLLARQVANEISKRLGNP